MQYSDVNVDAAFRFAYCCRFAGNNFIGGLMQLTNTVVGLIRGNMLHRLWRGIEVAGYDRSLETSGVRAPCCPSVRLPESR